MKHPAYPKYKTSGVEWLGDVPEHWHVCAVWHLYWLGRGRVISHEDIRDDPGEFPVYSSQTENDGVLGCLRTHDFEGDYVTWTTDGANAGTVFRRTGKFNCTNVCGTLKESSGNRIDNRFAAYALNLATGEFVRHDINPKLMNNVMAKIRIGVPSITEQRAIASFLDRETGRMDRLVTKNRELIERLKEKRTALISRTVTQGLPPAAARAFGLPENPPLKPSGIDWLGEIPNHWDVKCLKFIFPRLLSGVSVNSDNTPTLDESPAILKTSCVYGNRFQPEENKRVLESELDRVSCPVTRNSLIISRMNTPDLVGNCGYTEKNYPNLFLPDRLWIARFAEYPKHPQAIGKFAWYLVISHALCSLTGSLATGTSDSMKNLTQEAFLNIPVGVPPLPEQIAIAGYLDAQTAKIDALVGKIEQAVERLQEYCTALITAAVTGKIDVRTEACSGNKGARHEN